MTLTIAIIFGITASIFACLFIGANMTITKQSDEIAKTMNDYIETKRSLDMSLATIEQIRESNRCKQLRIEELELDLAEMLQGNPLVFKKYPMTEPRHIQTFTVAIELSAQDMLLARDHADRLVEARLHAMAQDIGRNILLNGTTVRMDELFDTGSFRLTFHTSIVPYKDNESQKRNHEGSQIPEGTCGSITHMVSKILSRITV